MRRRGRSLRLSAFKRKGAKLNWAIFEALAKNQSLTAYEIYKHVRKRAVHRRKLYSVINRRVRSLAENGYLRRAGQKRIKAGFEAPVYSLTPKAYLAILLSQLDLEKVLEKIDDAKALQLIGLLLEMSVS